MKINKLKSIALLAFAGASLLATSAHAGAVVTPSAYADGDLILGVRATGGTGASKDVLVDLGSAASLASGSITTGNLSSALTDAFGAGWAARSDLQVGIIGTTGPVGTPAKTLFASRARTDASTPSTAWLNGSSFAQGAPSSKIETMVSAFSSSTSTSAVTETTSDTNNWSSFVVNASGSFGFFNPTIEGTPAQTLDVFQVVAATVAGGSGQSGTLLGTFKLNADATVTFTNASDVSAISFAASSVQAARSATTVTLNLTRTNTASAVTATLTATNGTATAPDVSSVTPISFAAGVSTASVTITITPNAQYTPRNFTVGLTGFTAVTGTAVAGATPSATVILPGAEAIAPSLTVTAPTATAATSGATATGDLAVAGTVDDNVAVASATVQVNGGTATALTLTAPATPVGNQQVFSQTLAGALSNGLNTVVFTLVDSSANTTTVTRYVRYTAQVAAIDAATKFAVAGGTADTVATLLKTPKGPFIVGNSYVVTVAKQFDSTGNFMFSNWSIGGVKVGTDLSLTFQMTTALLSGTITANYVATPFAAAATAKGTFAGLVTSGAGFASTNATNGYISATVSGKGALTASLTFNGSTTKLIGFVNSDGSVQFGAKTLTSYAIVGSKFLTLSFNSPATTMSGNLYDGTDVSNIVAPLQTAPSAAALYTFRMGASALFTGTPASYPQGDSVGVASVGATGVVTGTVYLSDNSIGTFSTFLSSTGTFPLYASPYGGKTPLPSAAGSISGVVAISGSPALAASTGVKWFRPASATTLFTSAWSTTVDLAGSVYVATALPLAAGTGTATLTASSGANSTFSVTDSAGSILPLITDKVNKIKIGTNGLVTGTYGVAKSAFTGVAIQNGATTGVSGFWTNGTSLANLLRIP